MIFWSLLMTALIPFSSSAEDKTTFCTPLNVTYQIEENIESLPKDKKVSTPAKLNFSVCQINRSAAEMRKSNLNSFAKRATDFLYAYLGNEQDKFSMFFDETERQQYEAFSSQRKSLAKYGIESADKVLIKSSIESKNWALFAMELKPGDRDKSFLLKLKKNKAGQIVYFSRESDQNPVVDLFNKFFTDRPLDSKQIRKSGYAYDFNSSPSLGVPPFFQFEFDVLKPGDDRFAASVKFFSELKDAAQSGNQMVFLNQVANPEAYRKSWEWDKANGVKNSGLKVMSEYLKKLVPVAALDLAPVTVMYFADSQKTKILQIHRFLKNEKGLILLGERLDLNAKLYGDPKMKSAALETVPFASLKLP